MCGSMADILSPTAEIRRGKKKEIETSWNELSRYAIRAHHYQDTSRASILQRFCCHGTTTPRPRQQQPWLCVQWTAFMYEHQAANYSQNRWLDDDRAPVTATDLSLHASATEYDRRWKKFIDWSQDIYLFKNSLTNNHGIITSKDTHKCNMRRPNGKCQGQTAPRR